VQKIPFLPRYWTISRKQYAQYTNLWKHTLKSSLKRFSKSGSVPNKIESEALRTLTMRHVAFQKPNLGPWGLGDSKSPMFFFDLGDVIGANHPLQPCADDGSGCQSSSPGFFRQYGKETTDLKGRQWDTIHGQAEISNNTPQFVASRQFYKFIHEMISQFVNAHQILNAHLQFSR
jgi:hypothetical protein